MGVRMDGRSDEWAFERTGCRTDGRSDGQTDGQMDRWTNIRTDGWMDGRVKDGQMVGWTD